MVIIVVPHFLVVIMYGILCGLKYSNKTDGPIAKTQLVFLIIFVSEKLFATIDFYQ